MQNDQKMPYMYHGRFIYHEKSERYDMPRRIHAAPGNTRKPNAQRDTRISNSQIIHCIALHLVMYYVWQFAIASHPDHYPGVVNYRRRSSQLDIRARGTGLDKFWTFVLPTLHRGL